MWRLRDGDGATDYGAGASRSVGAVGPPFDSDDDRAVDQAIEHGHGQRRVAEILPPGVEVDVGDQDRGALLVSAGDDLVQEVRGLRAFLALDAIEAKFVHDQEIPAAYRLSVSLRLLSARAAVSWMSICAEVV